MMEDVTKSDKISVDSFISLLLCAENPLAKAVHTIGGGGGGGRKGFMDRGLWTKLRMDYGFLTSSSLDWGFEMVSG